MKLSEINCGCGSVWQPSSLNWQRAWHIHTPLGCRSPYQNGSCLVLEPGTNGSWKFMEFDSQISMGTLSMQVLTQYSYGYSASSYMCTFKCHEYSFKYTPNTYLFIVHVNLIWMMFFPWWRVNSDLSWNQVLG